MISPLKKQTSLTTITIAGQNKAKKTLPYCSNRKAMRFASADNWPVYISSNGDNSFQ